MPNPLKLMMGTAGVAGGPEGDPGELWSIGGRNHNGQLGLGNVLHVSSPTQVGSLTDWVLLGASGYVVHCIKSNGSLWGWGEGQTGNGTTIQYSSPIQIGANTNWNKIGSGNSAGDGNDVNLITSDYKLFAWGKNNSGSIGDGTVRNGNRGRSSPVQIGGSVWAEAAVGGAFSAAIRTDGTLWTWGDGANGSTAHGDVIDHSSPVQVGSLTNWSKLFLSRAGTAHALKTDGTLWGWGVNSHYGQIGDGTTIARSSPVQIGAETDWTVLGGGSKHTLAIRNNGQLFAWGRNTDGQLGQGNVTNLNSPVQVGALSTWKAVGSGGNHSVALKTDGTLWTWGNGDYGALGQGDVIKRSSPVQVGSLTTWLTISSGGFMTIATKTAS